MNRSAPLMSVKGLLVFLTPVFCIPYAINAYSADSSFMVEEIVVTARKRQENMQDVPGAISAFSRETLQEAGVDNIIELENLTPNITMNRRNKVITRCVSYDNSANKNDRIIVGVSEKS